MEQEIEMPPCPLLGQNARDILVRRAGMDGERQAGELRGTNIGAEILLLNVPWRLVVEIIEADSPMPMTFGCAASAAIASGSATGNSSAAWFGWIPTQAQTLSNFSAISMASRDWLRVTPMVTIAPTPAARARSITSACSPGWLK